MEKVGDLSREYFIPEVHLLQQQLMYFYAKNRNPQKFTQVWNDYKKQIYAMQDVLGTKKLAEGHFSPDSPLVKDIQKTFEDMFHLYYGNDPRLLEYLI